MSLVATNAGPSGKRGWALDSSSLLKYHVQNLKVLFVLKETFISYGLRAETAEKQTQNLILWLAEWQCQWNSQPHKVTTVRLRSLTGEEWDTLSWYVDVCEDNNEAGDTEPLNSDESYVPVQAATPSLQEVTSYLSSKSLSNSVWEDWLWIAWGNYNALPWGRESCWFSPGPILITSLCT